MSEPREQCIDARLRPSLDDQGAVARIDIDTLARSQQDLTVAGAPSHRDLASQDQNRRSCFLAVHRPFGTAHGGDGLWRRNLKTIPASLFRGVDQQGLALEIDGIDVTIAAAALQRVRRAALGDDGHAATATQSLRRVRQLRGRAPHRGWLCRRRANAKTSADDSYARHPSERSHDCVSIYAHQTMLY